MIYEIQAEFIPGNNQIWISLKDQEDKFIYQYDTQEAAENAILTLQNNFPEGTNLRIVEKTI
jgi:hypothetical protein